MFATPRLHRITIHELHTFANSRLRRFQASENREFPVPEKHVSRTLLSPDVSRVTSFPEFPNSGQAQGSRNHTLPDRQDRQVCVRALWQSSLVVVVVRDLLPPHHLAQAGQSEEPGVYFRHMIWDWEYAPRIACLGMTMVDRILGTASLPGSNIAGPGR
jgi:hypothetical protein